MKSQQSCISFYRHLSLCTTFDMNSVTTLVTKALINTNFQIDFLSTKKWSIMAYCTPKQPWDIQLQTKGPYVLFEPAVLESIGDIHTVSSSVFKVTRFIKIRHGGRSRNTPSKSKINEESSKPLKTPQKSTKSWVEPQPDLIWSLCYSFHSDYVAKINLFQKGV